MTSGIFNSLTTALLHGQNQFASGGLLLMVIGGIAAYFKGIPSAIYNFVKKQTTIGMNITDEHHSFGWVQWWFQNREYVQRMRSVDAFTPMCNGVFKAMLKPAPGTHWFFYNKRPLFISFSRATETKGWNDHRAESYFIWTFGRDQSFLKNLLFEIHSEWSSLNEKKPSLMCWNGDKWRTSWSYSPRSLSSVILPSGIKEDLIKDIEKFKASATWYAEMGIPYHRGYLLNGPPGTGKTSLVSGLSSHFNSTVYILRLSDMTDAKLLDAINNAGDNSMIILEDIDCAVKKRTRIAEMNKEKSTSSEVTSTPATKEEPNTGITLSGLLNALDGMQTPYGAQFFMTTNHIEKLDSALLRPGRIDRRIYLGPATEWQKAQMYMKFFPESDGSEALRFVMSKPECSSMADFQEELMRTKNNENTSYKTAASR